MEIGFIGLGKMGQPMARRLIEAGHKLVIFDTRNDAAGPLLTLGAQLASSPADVADRVETVMASLPEPHIVAAVATGEGGVIHGRRIKRFVDLSTTGPRAAAEIAAALAKKNIVQIDSPVSGGVAGAVKGTLAVMVSGPQTEIDIVKEALGVFGTVFIIGAQPGMGQTAVRQAATLGQRDQLFEIRAQFARLGGGGGDLLVLDQRGRQVAQQCGAMLAGALQLTMANFMTHNSILRS